METGTIEAFRIVETDSSVLAAARDMLGRARDSQLYICTFIARLHAAERWSDAEIMASALNTSLYHYVKTGCYVPPKSADDLRKQWLAEFRDACTKPESEAA